MAAIRRNPRWHFGGNGMNDTTLNQLKVIVERSIRPVRVSVALGWRMRRELLAHVVAVFEEEVARDGDEGLALDRTVQRFGSPVELAGQLQESAQIGIVGFGFLSTLLPASAYHVYGW